ncbi:hypothetical protein JCM10450v2_005423 [Rhodotorula kratochvilovae]
MLASPLRQLTSAPQVTRLTADLQVRRTELSRLYTSLDSILTLHPLPNSRTPLPIPAPASAQPAPPARPPSSVLDLPGVRAAAAHSRAREFLAHHMARSGESGTVPKDVAETLRLEEEVRNLEVEIARLDGAEGAAAEDAQAASSVLPADGSQTGAGSEHPDPHTDLLDTIAHLEGELDRVRAELAQADNERTTLRRLLQEKEHATRQSGREEALLQRVERLEDERRRLSSLLRASESESATLQSQLTATHASLDALAARVHAKLLEQKDKLRDAWGEVRRLEGEVRRLRGEGERLRRELERREGRGRSGSGSGEGRTSSVE